jgi:predicted cupin superfamily sugar epimerase
LELAVGDTVVLLGPDVLGGEQPQAIVPPRTWQAAVSTGAWTLVSCVVAPGFQFDGFELAPPDWSPTDPAPR